MTVAELSPPDAVSAARHAGYDSVDLRLLPVAPGDKTYDLSARSPVIRQALERMASTGIPVFDVEQIKITRELDIRLLEPFFETVVRLGARRVKVAAVEPDRSMVVDKMAAICERMRPHDISVDLEFMMWSSVPTLKDAEQVVAAMGCDNAGILVDALHLSRSGGTPADIAGIPPRRFGYVHLCDAPAALPADTAAMLEEARTQREFPGEGELPLVSLLRTLPAGLTVSVELALRDRGYDAQTRARLGAESARRVIALADHRD
nr:sugar phosphate isomerase/epimerase [Bradyrhizobium centrolobii]